MIRCPSSVFGSKLAVDEQRRPKSRANRHHEDDAFVVPPRAEMHFRQPCRVRVVDHVGAALGSLFDQRFGIDADPRVIDIRRRVRSCLS